jgi:hypothetical protein
MALGSTQPLIEMSTRNFFSGVKVAGAKGSQKYQVQLPPARKSGSLKLLERSGPVIVLHSDCFVSTYALHVRSILDLTIGLTYKLTPWRLIIFQILAFLQIFKKFTDFYSPTLLHPESDESNKKLPTL